MSSKSETWNAYESKLNEGLNDSATSVTVVSAAGLVAPCYLVIDPDVPEKREWVYVREITDNTLSNMVRHLAGSVQPNTEHASEATIRAVFTKQLQDDIFNDIEDGEATFRRHTVPGEPGYIEDSHPQYLLDSTAANTYLALAGNPNHQMTGILRLREGAPGDPEEATRKDYVDGVIVTHAAIDDAHHSRYTDVEAIAAAATDNTFLRLTGGVVDGHLQVTGDFSIGDLAGARLVTHESNPNVWQTYVSGGPGTGTRFGLQFFGNGGDFLDVSFDGYMSLLIDPISSSHVGNRAYNDGRYVLDADGPFLPLAGGTVSGDLVVQGIVRAQGELAVTGDVAATGVMTAAKGHVTQDMSFAEWNMRNFWIGNEPASKIIGDIWFDTTLDEVKAWSGTVWTLLIKGV